MGVSRAAVPFLDLPYNASIRSIKLNSTLRINVNRSLSLKSVDGLRLHNPCAPEGPYEVIEAAEEA